MRLPGADDLIKVFGRWPSFHDAEVLRFLLERSEPFGAGSNILADVQVFEVGDQVAPEGTYVLRNRIRVSFRFGDAAQVILDGFNNQKTLRRLAISDSRGRQLESREWEIHFASSLRMGAKLLRRTVTLERARPWEGSGENAG